MKLLVKCMLVTGACVASCMLAAGQTPAVNAAPSGQMQATYRIDASQSRFMVHAHRGGFLWFKGHDHFVKVDQFSGDVQLTPTAISPASLTMTIDATSLGETGADFTPEQKQIIKKELNEIVLETAKYPQITFRSTDVTAKPDGTQFGVRITGDITLHGVTRPIVIPATVSVEGDNLRSKGEFTLNRKDFGVKATTAGHGTVRVRHKLTFTFDIVARKA